MPGEKSKVVLREATLADIESMATMVPRAYAPDAFLPQIIPDTPAVRKWWAQTYEAALQDPAARLLIAVDGCKTVGILTLHYLDPDSPSSSSCGVTAAIPLTPDHSPILAKALEGLEQERKELMGADAHFLIELVGVDDEYKSLGIGRALAQWACEIADEKDAAIYLQTSAAKYYYTKKLNLGFEARKSEEDQGAGGTVIRPRKSKAHALSPATQNTVL
ncbi:hypothetical protein M433DRAFT_156491 [Acidomyces richmondensis BFW]|nr:MAG: hypothetical protein FE78DRAFT_93296 [Acidomyces sp. 'richmondensis']KYG43640.1 hypothetical protein M433DRAFT_156491 [Acidomyces richmondensis BFW]